jgi:hypothetical protein
MPRFLKIFCLSALIVALAVPAGSQPMPSPPGTPPAAAVSPGQPPPIPPDVVPQWVPAPGSPRVAYAPNVPANIFLLHRRYFYFFNGQWYRSKSLGGPWHPVRKVPKALQRLQPSAFK